MIAALESLEEMRAEREAIYDHHLAELDANIAELDAKVKEYVLKKDSMEVPGYKLTVVRGMMRGWDSVKLERLVPKGLFLKIVDYTANPDKIDELVKAGKIDAKKIRPAFIETPKAPYVKVTKVKEQDSSEADRVAEALA